MSGTWREEVLAWFEDRSGSRLDLYGGYPDRVYPDIIPGWLLIATLDAGKDYAAPDLEAYRWAEVRAWHKRAKALMRARRFLSFEDAMWEAEADIRTERRQIAAEREV